jgi:hypothetical protein
MRRLLTLAVVSLLLPVMPLMAQQIPDIPWPPTDSTRPRPPVVTPAPAGAPVPAPSDAVVLFDGKDLSQWRSEDGKPAAWTVRDGYMEVKPGTGAIQTAAGYGSVQLHIEWMSPTPPHGEGQERGNSGVFLMGMYEVQVLDSYDSPTYADGQAASIYGQYPPLVDASRKPGEWQTYDIIFHAPVFRPDGSLERPATMTVFHNGVLVQDHAVLTGPTAHQARPPYKAHADKLPLMLQDHGSLVRYREVWVRELKAEG